MKVPFCLLTVMLAGSVSAQNGGGTSVGGVSVPAGTPTLGSGSGGRTSGSATGTGLQSPLSTASPATLPGSVLSSPLGTSPTSLPASAADTSVSSSAGTSGILNGNTEPLSPIGDTPSTGVRRTAAFETGNAGLGPIDPTPPPITETAGPIRGTGPLDLNGDEIIDPSGATRGDQGTLGVPGASTTGTGFSQQGLAVQNAAFANQFQMTTGQNGSTQVAFPAQNAVVTVVSQNGVLSLQGAVTSEQQRRSIEEAVRNIAGGAFIMNDIQVSPALGGTP